MGAAIEARQVTLRLQSGCCFYILVPCGLFNKQSIWAIRTSHYVRQDTLLTPLVIEHPPHYHRQPPLVGNIKAKQRAVVLSKVGMHVVIKVTHCLSPTLHPLAEPNRFFQHVQHVLAHSRCLRTHSSDRPPRALWRLLDGAWRAKNCGGASISIHCIHRLSSTHSNRQFKSIHHIINQLDASLLLRLWPRHVFWSGDTSESRQHQGNHPRVFVAYHQRYRNQIKITSITHMISILFSVRSNCNDPVI